MQILVEGKTLTVTTAMREFVAKQAKKLESLGLKISYVRVFLENVARKTGEENRAEVRYKVEIPGKDVVVEKKGHDLYAVIVAATERVKLQLTKLKQKQVDLRRGKHAEIPAE